MTLATILAATLAAEFLLYRMHAARSVARRSQRNRRGRA